MNLLPKVGVGGGMRDSSQRNSRGNLFLAAIAFMGMATLAAILVIPRLFIRPRNGGQLSSCKSNLKNLGTGLEMYASDHAGRLPPSMAHLTPNYLKTFPKCPTAGRDTYSSTYTRVKLPVEPSAFCPTHGSTGPCANYGRRLLQEASLFRDQHQRWPKDLEEMRLPQKLLACPYGGASLVYSLVQETYSLCCGGLNHRQYSLPADRPAYDGIVGLIER